MGTQERDVGRRHRWLAAGAAAALLVALCTAVTLGSIPDANGLITGCYSKAGGGLRVIDTASQNCKDGETVLPWNQQGPPGPRGLPGEQGPAGVSGYEFVDTATAGPFDPFGQLQITAYCSPGKRPLGGGYFVDLAAIHVLISAPFLSDVGNGWHIVAANTTDFTTGQLIAYAVCADVS